MISLRKFNTATKFLFLLAPILLVSGCTTVSHSPSATSKAAALAQAEPGPERLLRYCRRMADTNNIRIAVGVCKRALETAPDNPAPVLALAGAYLSAQQDNEAAEAFRFALTIDPTNSDAHYGLGKLHLRKSELSDAGIHLEAALSSKPTDPAIYNALGVLKDQLGDHNTAQTLYRSGLEIDPENTALSNNLGVSLLLSEKLSEGMTVLGSVDAQTRPNEIRRQNLATALEAIAAFDSSRSPSSFEPETMPETANSALQNVRTVSAPNSVQSNNQVYAGLRSASAVTPNKPVSRVKARQSAPPRLSTMASIVTTGSSNAKEAPSSSAVVLDSLQNASNLDLHPVITPAPVQVVDFQTLPPLPQKAEEKEQVKPVVVQQVTILAEELPDLTHAAVPAAATVSVDLAKIIPLRKPLALAAAKAYTSDQPTPSVVSETTEKSHDEVLTADILHLPNEPDVEPNGSAVDRNPQGEQGRRAESQISSSQVAKLERVTLTESPWSTKSALPGDELRAELTSVEQPKSPAEEGGSNAQSVFSDVAESNIPGPLPTADEGLEGLSLPSTPVLVRRHQSDDVGLDDQAPAGSAGDSPPPADQHWSFDLASLPTGADQSDQSRRRKPQADQEEPYEPALPLEHWPHFIANRESPPVPDPAPRGERLLALMMIHRENFSTA